MIDRKDEKLNSASYWDERFLANWEERGGKEQTAYFACLALQMMPDWLKTKIKKEKLSILDVGCAQGEAVDCFGEYFHTQVSGGDVSEVAIQKAKERYGGYAFARIDLCQKSDERVVDVVYCSNVLEHFYEPWPIARNALSFARQYAVLMVPFRETMLVDEHVYRFTEENIPLTIGVFQLVHVSVSDCRKIEHTCYADKQALLVYALCEKGNAALSNLTDGLRKMAEEEGLEKYVGLSRELLEEKERLKHWEAAVSQSLVEWQKQQELQEQARRAEREELQASLLRLSKENGEMAEKLRRQEEHSREAEDQIASDKQTIGRLGDRVQKLQSQLESMKSERVQLEQNMQMQQKQIEYMRNSIYHYQIEEMRVRDTIWGKLLHASDWMKSKLPQVGLLRAIRHGKLASYARDKLRESGHEELVKRVLPETVQGFLKRRIASETLEISQNALSHLERDIETFVGGIQPKQRVWMVLSGVEYIDSEGQRNVRIVHEAVKKGIKVIYVYFRWDTSTPVEPANEQMLFVPLDYLYEVRNTFFEKTLVDHPRKSLIVEFPHRYADELISIANCFRWTTVYDVIDDWEEFSKKGQAVWYSKEVEQRVVASVDINIATAKRLRQKMMEETGVDGEYEVISNGVDIERIRPVEREKAYDFRKGDLQIGYFGHLTASWFDWELVTEMAHRNPSWTFHLIGYGAPENLNLPDNVILYGKKKPEELARFAAYWDVATIPFINCELTLGVNPIKIYEYLRLKLPVVASNMPEIADAPYTRLAVGVEAFEQAIAEAAKTRINEDVVLAYVTENTWERKCDAFIESIERFDVTKSYKRMII